MDRATLKSSAKEQIKGKIGILFLISLLASLIAGAVSAVPLVGTIAGMLLSGAFSLAMIQIYMNLGYGRRPEVGDLFSQMRNILPAFCTQFLVGLFTFLWSLLLFVPGIIMGCAYSQAMYILADDPGIGPMEAIRRSKEMMEGHKMEYFVLCLSFYGWALLGAFTLGILYIWLIPYMQATMANYYRSLKGEFVEG
jgi:uncharacterized membrane protein